jgi:amidase
VAAGHAQPQVHPRVADPQAFFAAVSPGGYLADLIDVSACVQCISSVRRRRDRTPPSQTWNSIANLTGNPAMSVPLAWGEGGLPIGLLFTGRYGDEATLFRLAGQLERSYGWAARVPS